MTNATNRKPIFNSFTKIIAELHFISGGPFAAIKYLRSLGLPFLNAKRLVFDFLINPPKAELPYPPKNPSLN